MSKKCWLLSNLSPKVEDTCSNHFAPQAGTNLARAKEKTWNSTLQKRLLRGQAEQPEQLHLASNNR